MNRVEINEVIFKKMINCVKHSITKDDSRPELKYILIKVLSNEVIAYSLDGYRASKVTISLSKDVNYGTFECYIKPISIKTSVRELNNVVIESDDKRTYVTVTTDYGNLVYTFNKPEIRTSVNVENVYSAAKEHDREVALNCRFVAEAMKSLQSVSKYQNMCVIENKDNSTQPVIIRAKTDNFINEQLILPIHIFEEK